MNPSESGCPAVKNPSTRSRRLRVLVSAACATLVLFGCGGDHGPTYSIGGTVSGLSTAGLVLADGSSTVTPAAGATSFTFTSPQGSGYAYNVSVQTQPSGGVTCAVTNGTGTVASAAVTSIAVSCQMNIALTGAVSAATRVAHASVTAYDAKGQSIASTNADANGVYSLQFDGNLFAPAPYVLKADGLAGNASVSLVSLATGTGTVNISPLSHAIATSLSANPYALTSGHQLTSAQVNAADTAYASAFGNLMQATGVTGSLITSPPNSAWDNFVASAKAITMPNGAVYLATTGGLSGDDLAQGATQRTPLKSVYLAPGQLPAATNATSLPAHIGRAHAQSAARPQASAGGFGLPDMSWLQTQLNACFAQPAASRGTPQAPSAACDGLVSTSDINLAGGFKHAGFRWLDNGYTPPNRITPYWAGMFGSMLPDPSYDNVQFLAPVFQFPNSTGDWVVTFPMQYPDGTTGQLGDNVNSDGMVVRQFPALVSGVDPGWRFYGDQRDFNSSIKAMVQQIKNVYTGDVRQETGISIYVQGGFSRTYVPADGTTRAFVVNATVIGGGLPLGGILLQNKGSGTYPGTGGTPTWTNDCSGSLSLSFISQVSGTAPLQTTSAACAAFLRLAYSAPATYQPLLFNNAPFISSWGNNLDASPVPGVMLVDGELLAIGANQQYLLTLTLSDGTTLNYINRMNHAPLLLADLPLQSYPTFDTATETTLKTYVGASAAALSWLPITTSMPFAATIYWADAAGSTSSKLGYGATSTSIPCTGACATASNWQGSTPNPNRGIFQLRSRTFDDLLIMEQLRQY